MKIDDNFPEYTENYISKILSSVKTIAMIGASPDPTKFSYGVLRVLHEQGYKMFPVNPKEDVKQIRKIKVYNSIFDIKEKIDMVQVFRKSDSLPKIAEEAVEVGAKVLWGQIGVYNKEAEIIAKKKGLKVVMNRCPKIELFRPFWKPKLNLKIW